MYGQMTSDRNFRRNLKERDNVLRKKGKNQMRKLKKRKEKTT